MMPRDGRRSRLLRTPPRSEREALHRLRYAVFGDAPVGGAPREADSRAPGADAGSAHDRLGAVPPLTGTQGRMARWAVPGTPTTRVRWAVRPPTGRGGRQHSPGVLRRPSRQHTCPLGANARRETGPKGIIAASTAVLAASLQACLRRSAVQPCPAEYGDFRNQFWMAGRTERVGCRTPLTDATTAPAVMVQCDTFSSQSRYQDERPRIERV